MRHVNMSAELLGDGWTKLAEYTFGRNSGNTISSAVLNDYRCYIGPNEGDVGNKPNVADDIMTADGTNKIAARVCRPTNGQAGAVVIIW